MRLFLKIGFVAAMTIAILIPLLMIRGVISDRQMYRAQAVADISRSYAGAQSFAGPVLVVPYTEEVEVEEADQFNVVRKVRRAKTSQWVFFPTTLDARGTLAPDTRKRGLHEVRVYERKGKATASGIRTALNRSAVVHPARPCSPCRRGLGSVGMAYKILS